MVPWVLHYGLFSITPLVSKHKQWCKNKDVNKCLLRTSRSMDTVSVWWLDRTDVVQNLSQVCRPFLEQTFESLHKKWKISYWFSVALFPPTLSYSPPVLSFQRLNEGQHRFSCHCHRDTQSKYTRKCFWKEKVLQEGKLLALSSENSWFNISYSLTAQLPVCVTHIEMVPRYTPFIYTFYSNGIRAVRPSATTSKRQEWR